MEEKNKFKGMTKVVFSILILIVVLFIGGQVYADDAPSEFKYKAYVSNKDGTNFYYNEYSKDYKTYEEKVYKLEYGTVVTVNYISRDDNNELYASIEEIKINNKEYWRESKAK